MSRAATYWAVPRDRYLKAIALDDPGEELYDYVFNDEDWPSADIANCYEPLDFVLTGSAEGMVDENNLLSVAVNGRGDEGVTDLAMIGPDLVPEVRAALVAVDPEQLRDRVDLDQLEAAGLYPGGFAGQPGWTDAIVEALVELQGFYATAADQGMAVLVDIG